MTFLQSHSLEEVNTKKVQYQRVQRGDVCCGAKSDNDPFDVFITEIHLISSLLPLLLLPVMAAVAVRKKVVSIGHFSPCFCLQSWNFFHLLDQIKSNYMY